MQISLCSELVDQDASFHPIYFALLSSVCKVRRGCWRTGKERGEQERQEEKKSKLPATGKASYCYSIRKIKLQEITVGKEGS